MFKLYRITLALAQKPTRTGLLFTHENSDFAVIYVSKGSSAAPLENGDSHIR